MIDYFVNHCKEKNMERKYENSLEQLGAASLEYAIAIGSYPYSKEEINVGI